jgi:hypothetical protein
MKAFEQIAIDITRWGKITAVGPDEDGCTGTIRHAVNKFKFIASWGEGWEHVSIRLHNQQRCPLWDEMCFFKDLFWRPDETVMQLHPSDCDYINNHPYVLHLWKPIGIEIPTPPLFMV